MNSNQKAPRVLYVSEVAPGRSGFGGAMRCSGVLRALQEMARVETVILNESDQDPIVSDGGFDVAYALEMKPRLNRGLVDRIRWTLDPKASYPHGCGVDHSGMSRILRSLDEFDLIWFFDLRSPDMFPYAAWRRSVVDIDNLPSTYARADFEEGTGHRERLLALRRLLTWRRREALLRNRFSVLTVCSEEDKKYLTRIGAHDRIHVIPNGFDKPRVEPLPRTATPPRIGFVGLFDYLPNRDGIEWFLSRCWPLIRRDVPDVRLRLVGQDRAGALKQRPLDVDMLGWLANPSDEMQTWSVMVVPIRIGAGTRIKIAHGFSQKCPIVSTSFGAYGYGVLDGHQMYLADSAEAFAAACVSVIREPEKAAQMAERAFQEFLNKWTWEAIRPLVWAAAEDCIRQIC